MAIFTIIGGINGVGKSSFSGVLKEQIPDLGFIVNTDEIAKENCISNIEAGKIALSIISNSIYECDNFAQETTLSGTTTEKNILKAKEKGYTIRMYYIGINNLVENIIRIENRVRKGGHNISVEDVTRRFNKRYDDFLRILPYCDVGEIYDNENGFIKLADIEAGRITNVSDNIPDWFAQMLNLLDYSKENDNIIESEL